MVQLYRVGDSCLGEDNGEQWDGFRRTMRWS